MQELGVQNGALQAENNQLQQGAGCIPNAIDSQHLRKEMKNVLEKFRKEMKNEFDTKLFEIQKKIIELNITQVKLFLFS